jgi:hypothetical protein
MSNSVAESAGKATHCKKFPHTYTYKHTVVKNCPATCLVCLFVTARNPSLASSHLESQPGSLHLADSTGLKFGIIFISRLARYSYAAMADKQAQDSASIAEVGMSGTI